ncbi:MAG: hypothetical protein JST16_18710, partial [Bdellovibrionales bacterium]|nr:hypothetical protein [Bdellovibrionales bacterium]
ESVEDITRVFAFHMTCERGKRNLGQGNNSVGDLIPGYVHELGFQNIDVHISDKATPWLPPYDLPEQQAILAQDRDWVERNFWIWDRNETQRNYLAGGGRADDFEATYQLAMQRRRDFLSAVESGTYHCAGGSMQYLISATK